MPMPVSLRLLEKINSEAFYPLELLDIRPVGAAASSTLRLCGGGQSQTWNGNTYTPVHMGRGATEQMLVTDSAQVPALTMTLGVADVRIVIDGDEAPLVDVLNEFEIEGATAAVRITDRELVTNANDAVQLTIGEIRGVVMTEVSVMFQIVPILGQMTEIVPKRLWQQKCNVAYGSAACLGATPSFDLMASPNTIASSALSGSTEKYIRVPAQLLTDAGDPTNPSAFWVNGYVMFTSGRLTTQARPFQRYENNGGQRRLYLEHPFLRAPDPSDSFIIRRGCPKTKEGCEERQGHVLNYQGYEEVPYGNIKPSKVKGYTVAPP